MHQSTHLRGTHLASARCVPPVDDSDEMSIEASSLAIRRVDRFLEQSKADKSKRIDQLRAQYEAHERTAASLAHELRTKTDSEGKLWLKLPESDELRSQLQQAISKAFDCRVEYQQAQLANASHDIATAAARISRRKELRDKVIA